VAVIVVAEDDPDIQEIIRLILERDGHTVIAVADGAAALGQARAVTPDLLLLDGEMPPGLSGFEASRHLATDERLARIPVVMVTGASRPAVIRDRLPFLDDVVVKPFSRETLTRAVRLALGRDAD
jgi:CheY-like chemotaxis protein